MAISARFSQYDQGDRQNGCIYELRCLQSCLGAAIA